MELNGFKISVRHLSNKKKQLKKTVCSMEINGAQYVGIAQVHKNDVFSKREGRKLALQRLMENSPLTKEQRTGVWTEYFSVGNRI